MPLHRSRLPGPYRTYHRRNRLSIFQRPKYYLRRLRSRPA
nr:MAG TPA: hypothetical protein [Caudoviricetes sp.]